MDEAAFFDLVNGNPVNRAILARLPALELRDAWLVSGALFQSAWNALTGRPPTYGIKDYDVFYFDDSDLSWEAEDAVIRRARKLFADLDVEIELRNQTRVHLWYERHFGVPYAPLGCACDGIDRFLSKVSMVGIQAGCDGPRLYAPCGLQDIADMIVQPNRTANFDAGHYETKAQRWKACWPEVTIEPAD